MATKKLDPRDAFIAEIDRFAGFLRQSEVAMAEKRSRVGVTKADFEKAKAELREEEEIQQSTVSLFLKFVRPGSHDVMPLFDTMEPADEKRQGAGAAEWRKEPIAVLALSAAALRALIAADVVLVGQLQDLLLADPEQWFAKLDGVTAGMAEAIAAKFAAYLEEKSR